MCTVYMFAVQNIHTEDFRFLLLFFQSIFPIYFRSVIVDLYLHLVVITTIISIVRGFIITIVIVIIFTLNRIKISIITSIRRVTL